MTGDAERKKQIADNAKEALHRLNTVQTVEDWRAVGAQLLVITEEVLRQLGLDAWDGENGTLTREFTRRFDNWQKTAANAKPLSKQERWALREFMTEQKYHHWLSELPMGPKRRKLSHPNAIINAYKRAHPDPSEIAAKREKLAARKFDIEPAIDKLCDHLIGMDDDGQRAVIERIVSPLGWSATNTPPVASDASVKVGVDVDGCPISQLNDLVSAVWGRLVDVAEALPDPKQRKRMSQRLRAFSNSWNELYGLVAEPAPRTKRRKTREAGVQPEA